MSKWEILMSSVNIGSIASYLMDIHKLSAQVWTMNDIKNLKAQIKGMTSTSLDSICHYYDHCKCVSI